MVGLGCGEPGFLPPGKREQTISVFVPLRVGLCGRAVYIANWAIPLQSGQGQGSYFCILNSIFLTSAV